MKKIMKKVYSILPEEISSSIRYWIELILYKLGINKNPGHSIKQRMIRNLQKKYKIKCLIETGTYMGDMIFSQIKNFDKIYSVELAKKYYDLAVKRFKNNKNVTIILGDSSIELGKLLNKIDVQSLVFLDGHFSGGETAKGKKECPLLDELDHFINVKLKINNHIIMIDDIRLCGTHKDYPNIKELEDKLKIINNNYKILIKNDQMIAYL